MRAASISVRRENGMALTPFLSIKILYQIRKDFSSRRLKIFDNYREILRSGDYSAADNDVSLIDDDRLPACYRPLRLIENESQLVAALCRYLVFASTRIGAVIAGYAIRFIS